MKRFLLAVVFLLFLPYSARADTNPGPDITGWNITNISRIELRLSDTAVAYLGLEMEYNNPNDTSEWVRVINRHIPLIVANPKVTDQRNFGQTVILFYADKEEQDRLVELSKKSDPFLYFHWRTRKENVTGSNILDGNVDVWFMSSGGSWIFTENQQVEIEFLTENITNGESHNVFSGMKYQLMGSYHLLRVDRNDIVLVFEGGK